MEEPEFDKVTQASLNGIYVKAQEMDRGHDEVPAPSSLPPGARSDFETHASTHASTHPSDQDVPSDAESHASAHASALACDADASADVESHPSTHASDGA